MEITRIPINRFLFQGRFAAICLIFKINMASLNGFSLLKVAIFFSRGDRRRDRKTVSTVPVAPTNGETGFSPRK